MTVTPAARRPAAAADLAPGSLENGVLMTIHRLSQGGADRVAMLLLNGFAAAGVPTALIVLRDRGEAEASLLDMLRDDVIVCCAGAATGSRHLELLRGLRFILRQTRRARPALVLASSSNMGLVTGIAARLRGGSGTRYAMKLTNPVIRPRDSTPVHRAYRRRLYDFIFGSFDQVLVLSDAERLTLERLLPRHRDRFATVANPYITDAMVPCRPCAAGTRQVLALARMMPQKRLDRLLDAFAAVTHADCRLTILGDGPGREALTGQAAALGIADRVDMPGFVEDVTPWLRRADLLALSSDYEGLPAVVLEALACEVPVVTTDCFEAAHALLDGAARCAVVARDDTAAFAHAIDASLADTTPITGGAFSERCRSYGVAAAVAAHLDVLMPAASEGFCVVAAPG